ncbi:MAG TPA: phage tail sheath C-terminal domain-containing protein [Steroidobacteraceae bacterium]|nr:phage tail sheath C-terminal domain-containing protein [Steroidobacteraceae bacterium]
MTERLAGIQVQEEAGPGQAIAEAPTAVTAFVGRCLRGPVDRPVRISGFNEFQRVFGGLWQPSTLAYAVEQYFENGGRTAVVVRVANGARCCTLHLQAGDAALVLEALAPGTREFLRAAVDYDGIGDNEDDCFNLVIQRVRTPGSEHIEDQEIYRRVSIAPEGPRSVGTVLAESALARVAGELPRTRPEPTPRQDPRGIAGYVLSGTDADDGAPLTDYDIIGSAARGTGLFALDAAGGFNFLCIPPLSREVDVGASTLLVANRFCRERRAILFVDPPLAWDSASKALSEMRHWPLPSDSACMYFPRLLGYDKLRGRFEAFAPSGAVAGMLSRASEHWPVWTGACGDEAVVRPGLRPACAVDDDQRGRLAAAGVNTVQAVRRPGRDLPKACTLAGPGAVDADWRSLAARRLAHLVVNSIEHGTRWLVFEPSEPATWRRATAQLRQFMTTLEERGAFAEREPGDRWFVVCDERLNRERQREQGFVNLLVGIPALRPGRFHAWLVSHRAGGSRVQTVSPNLAGLPDSGLTQVLAELELPPD